MTILDKRDEYSGTIQMFCKDEVIPPHRFGMFNILDGIFIHSCLRNLKLSDSVQVTNTYFVQSAKANVILVFGHYKKFFKLGV